MRFLITVITLFFFTGYLTAQNVSYGAMTDYDGNVYKTVKIGNQWWMAENLKVTHYNDGANIVNNVNNADWNAINVGAYCYYENDPANASTFGCLYNWYVVSPANEHDIAPTGWHVPTDDDWKELERTLGMSQQDADSENGHGTDEGSILAGRADLWADGDLKNNANFNSSGFTAPPGGKRSAIDGAFENINVFARFWAALSDSDNSSNAWHRAISCHSSYIIRGVIDKHCGQSVRLVKD